MALDYMDLEDQLNNTITIDEYAAKMGKDSDIVTLTFTVYSKLAAEDLVTWFERGYDFVLDASISDGEIEPGKWLVFVEMERRSKVPQRICNLLNDLETLTGYELEDWTAKIEGTDITASEDAIRDKMILNPNEYKKLKTSEENKLNEYRELAGIETKNTYVEDEYIKNIKMMAGL
jgi:predicted double-glycine peptidase